jgi:polysaccharide export outer membrane protein
MVALARTLVALLVVLLTALVCPALAQTPEYAIGARDVLQITVWGHTDLSGDYPVAEDGSVPFPLIGRVQASGLTVKAFAARLAGLLDKDYLVNPHVFVSVKEYLSKKVHVFGETEKPGIFYLTGPTTLLEVLSRAGGISKTAGKQAILVRNNRSTPSGQANGSAILRLNLERIQIGDTSENVVLEDEDSIFVPRAQAFFVLGEVKNAGTYPLERTITVLEALNLAGGLTDKAAPAVVKLIRQKADGSQDTMSLDLFGAAPKDRGVTLQEGDTVLVPRGNTFLVLGEVKSPGVYVLGRDTTVLEGITIAGGFTDKASPGRTRVIRTTATGQQVIYIDMNDIIKRNQRDKAITLQENDVVVVPQSFF